MRIAHVTDCYLPRLGGIEMQVHDLAVRQRGAGHQVVVITATPPSMHERGPMDAAGVRRLKAQMSNPASRAVAAGWSARHVLRADSYDAVHVHCSIMSPLATGAAWAATRNGLPTVVTIHSLWTGLGPLPRLADAWMRLRSWPLAWSAVSEKAAAPIRRMLGPDVPVSVLPNGIEPASWSVQPAPRDPRRVVVTSVMRLAPRKRPLHLLRMLRRVRDQVADGIDIQAVIIGEGPERANLERYLRRHRMDGWVSLPGRLEREQIRETFSWSDLYVAPAELESFGIAALEARCAGLPVVANGRGGVGEFIAHGREGLLAETDAGIVHALSTLIGSADLRSDMFRHNLRVAPVLNWATTLRLADGLYDTAADLIAVPGSTPESLQRFTAERPMEVSA